MPKKKWCCKHFDRGCLPPTTKTTSAPFNCKAPNPKSWPAKQSTWCCVNRNLGCRSDPFDCNAGFGNWKFGWSAKKEAWCCREKKVGCRRGPTTTLSEELWTPFNCSEDFPTWRSTWSHPKRQWCCRYFQKACEGTTQEPYDCSADYRNWQTGWSEGKRGYCCRSYNRGCNVILMSVNKFGLERWPISGAWPIRGHAGHAGHAVLTVLTAAAAGLLVALAVVACHPALCRFSRWFLGSGAALLPHGYTPVQSQSELPSRALIRSETPSVT